MIEKREPPRAVRAYNDTVLTLGLLFFNAGADQQLMHQDMKTTILMLLGGLFTAASIQAGEGP